MSVTKTASLRLALLAFALLSLPAFSADPQKELSPKEYETMKANATDVVDIRVTKVTTGDTPAAHIKSVEVDSTVLAVTKTQNGLKTGGPCRIVYMSAVRPADWTGPAPNPILTEGESYRVYLGPGKNPGDFWPTARSHSFEKL